MRKEDLSKNNNEEQEEPLGPGPGEMWKRLEP